MARRILISAGEISGDRHGARLVNALKSLDPTIEWYGMGHDALRDAGVEIKADVCDVATVGILEPLRYLPRLLLTLRNMIRLLDQRPPDLLIVIDYQGFHMSLIRAAKKRGIPVIYYISPQEWQWGTERGGQKVVALTDHILSIFREEHRFYQRLGGATTWVGHPILDLVVSSQSKADFYARWQVTNDKKIVSIFPGSRHQEMTYTLPVLLAAAAKIQSRKDDVQLFISISDPKFRHLIRQKLAESSVTDVIFFEENSHNLIAHSFLSLVTSGTVTLEHAVLGTPCISNYRFHPISFKVIQWLFGKKFKERIRYISLPNLLLKRPVIPEFIQTQCCPSAIAKVALQWLEDPKSYQKIKKDLQDVTQYLGPPGAIHRAAKTIIHFLNQLNTPNKAKKTQ